MFCFYSVGNHLYDTPALRCDQPKDPNVQYHLQSWALNNSLGISNFLFLLLMPFKLLELDCTYIELLRLI